ncbi:MAG: polyhydroxyalkanoic acid system family protein [Chloroflexi bacterium]|nr:polyhydroxyalkanoic acid system family protein [Chloroflexota bacterium]
MRIERAHHGTREAAFARIEAAMPELLAAYAGSITEVSVSRKNGILHFGFHALGYIFNGTLETNDTYVMVDVKLPVALLPFENSLKARLNEKLMELLQPNQGGSE